MKQASERETDLKLDRQMFREDVKDRMTREALADVAANRVIDHKAVLGWANSLGFDEILPLSITTQMEST